MKAKDLKEIKEEKKIKWPKVAIIILNWNGWKDTIECLESVFRNTYPNYQIIVVDNGSADGSMNKIKAWAGGKQEVLTPESTYPLYYLSHPPIKKPIPYLDYTREEVEEGGNFKLEEKITKELQEQVKINTEEFNPTTFHPLIFIQIGENLGFAGGNNVGLRYALARDDFDYVWLLNNDTVIKPNALTEMVKRMQEKPDAGICGSTLPYYYEPEKIWALGGATYNKWLARQKHIGQDQPTNQAIDSKLIEHDIDYITGASMLVSRSFLKDIGLMNEEYFLYFEEPDWAARARKKYSMVYAPNSFVYHKAGVSTKTLDKLGKKSISEKLARRNRVLFTRKYFIWVLPIVFLGLLYEWLKSRLGVLKRFFRIKKEKSCP